MAEAHIGRRREFAWIPEATRGTTPSLTGSLSYPHTGHSFFPVREAVPDESAMGSIPSRQGAKTIKEYSQGTVPFVLYDSMLTDLSTMVCGQAGTLVSTVTTYTLLNSNLHKTYSLVSIDPNAGTKVYPFGMLNNLTLNFNRDEYATGEAEFIAGKETSGTYTSAYSTTAKQFTCKDVTIKFASNYAGLATAEASVLKNSQLSIEKNVDPDFSLGSTELTDTYNQAIGINGSVTGTYKATTLRALGLSEGYNAVQIDLNNGAFKWSWIFPSVDFGTWNTTTDNDAYVQETLPFVVNYADKTNGFVILKIEDL